MSADDLATLLSCVDDTEVRGRLLPLRPPHFAAELLTIAEERGLNVDLVDVEAAVGVARRAWFERWV